MLGAIPLEWRRARVGREDLDRFLFEPDDVVIALGPDGLVANVAKYLRGQTVIGLNPDPRTYDGVLVKHPPEAIRDLLALAARRRRRCERRTMAAAHLDDGQTLLALNEIYVGHRTHPVVALPDRLRGPRGTAVVVGGSSFATGTRSDGLGALEFHRQRRCDVVLPEPEDTELVFFVREAFPSVGTGTGLTEGRLRPGCSLEVVSAMDDDGVLFGDGIEEDRIAFPWGARARIERAEICLDLI